MLQTMLNPAETIELLTRVDALLVTLGARVARIVIAGDLNAEQQANLSFALQVVDGLRDLFTAERARHSGSQAKES